MTKMLTEPKEANHRVPAKVYPAILDGGGWVVEAPASDSGDGLSTFTGRTALAQALEYAHRTYGSAAYFSR
jgi:hypothetical protein